MSAIAEYKTYLADYLTRYHNIVNPKSFFHCLSPDHTDNHPSMMFTDKYNICKCFSCGVSYDIFDLVGIDYNLDNFKDKIKKVEEIYLGYTPKVEEYKTSSYEECDYTSYFVKCIRNINKSKYLEGRGITKELIKKYKIGFDEERNWIVFPINKHCYFARSTINDFKFKSKGISDVWNKHLLKDYDGVVYVTEAIIDSLSLEVIDPNVKTVSINGVTNIENFVKIIKESNFSGVVVIVFDADYYGKKFGDELKRELTEMKISSFSLSLAINDCKDINQSLQTNQEKLKEIYTYVNENITRIFNAKKQEKEEVLSLG